MSCNGCRVLRKGCSEECMLRHCLEPIQSPQAQAHATLFVAKFFGRATLMSFLNSVPSHQRSALFRSLLYEAVGRTINPVNGAVGLLWTGNWHLCQLAVDKVLCGGALTLLSVDDAGRSHLDSSSHREDNNSTGSGSRKLKRKARCGGHDNDEDEDDVVVLRNFQARDRHERFLGRSSSPERVVVVAGGGRAATPSEESEASTLGSSAAHRGGDYDGGKQRKLLRLFF